MIKKLFPLVFLVVVVAADDFGMKYVMRIYEDCQRTDGIMPCLKKKAILFFDRAARMEAIPLVAGVDIVKTSDTEVVPVSENDIDANLPRNIDSKDEALTDMLWNRIATFANSRTIQLSLPKMSGEELNKGVEEGRGKMKKMMGMMMMGAAMKMAAMIPLAIAGLFILAGKALIVSKVYVPIQACLLNDEVPSIREPDLFIMTEIVACENLLHSALL
nr:uncharacterized protein LOC113398091 [Vanessa tameamea]